MESIACTRILEEAADMGVEEVAFSGGEPLLWEHIQDAVAQASSYGMNVFLYTTGNAPDPKPILKNLYTVGLSRAMFSLFGEDAQQHENITTSKGSYSKTLEIVKYCLNIGLETEFHFVPFSHNYQALTGIVKQAHRLGVERVSILRLVPQGRGVSEKGGQLNHSQNRELLKTIKELRGDGHDIRLGSPYNFLMLRDRPQCCSAIDRLTIGPELRIFPCDAFKHISPEDIGVNPEFSKLSNSSLLECWEKSEYLGVVREYLTTDFANTCQACRKLDSCVSGCMAQKYYEYGDLRKGPDPMCLLGNA
jgi:pyrroloquinoline quinone biosynthesis protein E